MVSETLKRAQELADEAIAKAKATAGQAVDATKDAVVTVAPGAVLTDSEEKLAKKMGISGATLTYFRKESDNNKALGTIFSNLEKDMADNPKYNELLSALGGRFKEEAKQNKFDAGKDTIIDLIGRDIKENPSLGEKLQDAMKSNPNDLAGRIANYKEGELATIISEISPPKAKSKKPATEAKAEVAAAAAAVTAPATPKPVAAPKAAAPVTPAAAVAAPPQPAANAPAAPAAVAAAVVAPAANPVDDLINDIAGSSGEELQNIVKNSVDAKAVVGIAAKMGQVATDKYGVSSSASEGFVKRVTKDEQLAARIATNFQNNPEFVKTLAKMSKDQSKLEEPMKSKAQQEMNKLMANAELLADDKHVKGLQAQIEQAEKFERDGGFMGMFKKMFGGGMGSLMSGFQDIGFMMAGMSGEYKVLSMFKGNSLIPNIMIDLDAYGRNKDAAMAFANYSPYDMTSLASKGADGKYFREVVTKNAQGKDVKEDVPVSQITLKTAGGNEVKVIPSVGSLVAKQMAGQYDQNGAFVPGNIRVPVVTSIDKAGNSTGISTVTLTPAQFAEYKKTTDELARQKGGSITELAFEDYTEKDARIAGKGPAIQIATVDHKSGTPGPLVTMQAGQPQAVAAYSGPGVTGFGIDKDGNGVDKRTPVIA